MANSANNYFYKNQNNPNAMETIIEEEKSGFISKHILAIPPEKIISQDNSLYTDAHLASNNISRANSRSKSYFNENFF